MCKSQKEGHYQLPVRLQHSETGLQQTKQFATKQNADNAISPIIYGLVMVLDTKCNKKCNKTRLFLRKSLYSILLIIFFLNFIITFCCSKTENISCFSLLRLPRDHEKKIKNETGLVAMLHVLLHLKYFI